MRPMDGRIDGGERAPNESVCAACTTVNRGVGEEGGRGEEGGTVPRKAALITAARFYTAPAKVRDATHRQQ